MPHSMISSTGSNHGTVTDTTVSTLDSFDPERDGATVSSQLNYSQKLPDLNVTANKYNRWNQRPSAEYVVNTSAIGRVFPKYADSDDNSNSSSSFSLNLGRAPLRQPLQQQQKQSPPKARSPLTTLTNIPHEFGRPKSPILSNADAFSRAGSFSKRPMAKMQPRVADENDSTTNTNTFTLSNKPGTYPKRSIAEMQPEVADANDSTTNTNTFTRSNKPATYPKRSIAEMQPEVADANDSTTNTNTYTRNSRFTHQQYASPNVSSKRQQQPSATNTPQHPFQQHATASTTSKPAQPSFHQETTPSAALKTAQPHLYRQTSTTHDPTQPSYHQNPTASTTHNPTHASFVLPAATSNSDSTTLDNGVPVITQGGHAHTRRGSRELVQAVSFGPVHSIIIPDDEEKIYLAIELLKSRVLRGEAENAELKAMYDQLKSAFNELRASHDQLAVSDNEHKQSLDSLKRSHTRSEDYSRSLEHENGILKEQNAGLEEQNQGLELAITDLQEKLEHASAFNSFHNQRSVSNKISAAASGPVHGNASSSRDIQAQHDHVNYRAPSVAASTLTREILSPSKDVQGEHEYRNHRATSAAASAPTHGVSPSKDVEGEHEYRNHRAPSVAASASTHGILSPSKDGQNEIQYQKQSAASVAASVPLHEKGSTSRSVQIQHQHQEPLAPSVRTRENVSSRDTQSQYQHRKQSAHSVTQEQHQKHPVLSASARHVLDSLCSEHNAKDCMLCTRVTSFGDKTTGGAPIRSANPVPVSKRMPVATPYEEEPTIRPSVEPGLALTTVIKGLEDEIAHLKMRQSEVQAQYQNLDASLGKRERRRIGKELESLLQQLEFKGDQLYGLYDVLEGMQ